MIVERWILAALRHRQHFSLGQLNATLREWLQRLNSRPFRKLLGCRREHFEQLDKPLLQTRAQSLMSTRGGRRPGFTSTTTWPSPDITTRSPTPDQEGSGGPDHPQHHRVLYLRPNTAISPSFFHGISMIHAPMAMVILYGLLSSKVLNMVVLPALCLRFGRTT